MNKPLVSILVLTYNHEAYIKECLNGILNQKTNFDVEILVGNDCSTDKTHDIVEFYANKHSNIKLFEPNSNQFSKGIDLFVTHLIPNAQGEYIAFCEGDDIWINEHKLQSQVDFLRENPSYSMCFHDHCINGDNTIVRMRYWTECDAHIGETLHLNLYQTATLVGKSSALKNSKFLSYYSHPLHKYSDVNILTSFFECGKVRHLVGDWSVYRLHQNSITANDLKRGVSELIHIDCLQALAECYPIVARTLLRDYRSLKLMQASCLCDISKWNALKLKLKALMTSPILILRLYLIKYHLI